MTAEERRKNILSRLKETSFPVSASSLASDYNVSRQIVVGDVALLRASGNDIVSTPRGYVLSESDDNGVHRIVCRHVSADTPRELEIIVDNGCTCRDVSVEHPIYGELTGNLNISSRYDIECFMDKLGSEGAAPLSALTDGIHTHNLQCPTEEAFRRVVSRLHEEGFLYD